MPFRSKLLAGNHEKLLARLREARTPVISMIAPPGYGKSRLAEAYAAGFQFSAVLRADCIDEEEITRWIEAPHAACLVVEDAHRIDESTLHVFMRRLLGKRRADSAIVVTSVRELGFPLGDLIEPHLTMTLRANDLAMSLRRLRSITPTAGSIDDITLYRIYQFSAGWPAVAYYLLASAARGQFDRDLSHLNNDAWADLFDWLGSYLEHVLDPQTRATLLEATVRLDATVSDFGDRHPENPALALVRNYQLADIGIAGELRVTPFIRLYLHVRCRSELLEVANAVFKRHSLSDPVRAARALINVGELRRAESLMASMDQTTCFSVGDYAYPGMLLEKLFAIAPPYQLYPRVWLALITPRAFAVPALTLAEEGITVLATADLSREMARWVRFVTALAFIRAGRLNVALSLIEELDADDDDEARKLSWVAYCILDVINGKFQRAIDLWNRGSNTLLETPTIYALTLRHIARAALATGDVTRTQEYIRLMQSMTSLGSSPLFFLSANVEAAIHAWLLGHDAEFARLRDDIATLLTHYEAPAYWRVVAAMHDLSLTGPTDSAPYLDTMGSLILACRPGDDAEAFADAAIREADHSKNAWLRCCTRVVSAVRQPLTSSDRLQEAYEIAAQSDAPLLVASVERFAKAQSELAHLSSLIERARLGHRTTTERESDIVVDVITGTVRRMGQPLKLSEGVLQLVMCLAVNRNGLSRERIIDLLWAEQDAVSALSALKMCVHRARIQLGNADSISVLRGKYALSPMIQETYHPLLELATRTVPIPLPDDARRSFDRAVVNVWESGEATWSRWTWFAPYQRAIGDAGQSIGMSLVRDAVSRGEHERALLTGRAMCAMRPFDERPRILIVQTYVAMSQHAEARREYNEYQELLRTELGMEPSGEFRALLRQA